jgi:hypothetical protein
MLALHFIVWESAMRLLQRNSLPVAAFGLHCTRDRMPPSAPLTVYLTQRKVETGRLHGKSR